MGALSAEILMGVESLGGETGEKLKTARRLKMLHRF